MNLYRFSPIRLQEQLFAAVQYIASQTALLAERVVGKSLPISSLTVFAHYADEYEQLVGMAYELGKPFDENNGPRVLLHQPVTAGAQNITHLRIRKPDPYRMQVGCNDFDVADYSAFKARYLAAHPDNLRCIIRPTYEMIEFFDPDVDVLAYVVSES